MNNTLIGFYESKTLKAQLYEKDKGILIFYPDGRINLATVQAFFSFLKKYKDKEKEGYLILLIDNSQISSIEMKTRVYVVDTLGRNSFLDIAASFGDNLLFATVAKVFTSVMSKLNIHHKVFKTEKEALDWASKFT